MRRAVGLAAVGIAILAAGCGGSSNPPAGSDRPGQEQGVNGNAEQVLATAEWRLGDAYAGGYVDDAGRPVVLTTAESTVDEARALGARTEVVQFSLAQLKDWQQQVGTALGTPPPAAVTSWGIDIPRNAVVVYVLRGEPVPAPLQQLVDRSGGAVVLDEAAGPVVPLPEPGG